MIKMSFTTRIPLRPGKVIGLVWLKSIYYCRSYDFLNTELIPQKIIFLSNKQLDKRSRKSLNGAVYMKRSKEEFPYYIFSPPPSNPPPSVPPLQPKETE